VRTAVEHHMGTAISITAPEETDPDAFEAGCGAAFALLHRYDEVFSTYLPDSAVSRLRDGRLTFDRIGAEPDADALREVLALCAQLHRESGGAFDAFAVGDPPAFDPSGAVKGWAAETAAGILAARGVPRFAFNAGGDVRVYGARDSAGEPWRVAIADPHRPNRILTVIGLQDGALATSGTAERGEHLWDPRTGRPATALAQVTVIGSSLTLADGYATAAYALGTGAAAWLTALARRTGYQAVTVTADATVWSTDPSIAAAIREARAAEVAEEGGGGGPVGGADGAGGVGPTGAAAAGTRPATGVA
jgi:FAD:protein FMN transferase